MKYLNKRGVLGDLENLVRALATFAILLVIVFLIIAQMKTQVMVFDGLNASGQTAAGTQGSVTYNATNQVGNAMSNIPSWLPIIVITVIGGVLLMLVSYFRSK